MPTPKGGSIARKAMAQEAKENAPVSLETMLGQGPTVTLCGREFRVYPVPLISHARLQKKMEILGDDYVIACLEQGSNGSLTRLAQMVDDNIPTLTSNDVEATLRLASASHTLEQIDAMLDFCVIAFNPAPPEGVTWEDYEPRVGKDVIGRYLTARAFPTVLRAVLDASGLNPTPLG